MGRRRTLPFGATFFAAALLAVPLLTPGAPPALAAALRPPRGEPRPVPPPPAEAGTGEAALAPAFRVPLGDAGPEQLGGKPSDPAGDADHAADPRAFLAFEARERLLVLDQARSRLALFDPAGAYRGEIPYAFPARAFDVACFPDAGLAFLLLEGTTAVGLLEADFAAGGPPRAARLLPLRIDAAHRPPRGGDGSSVATGHASSDIAGAKGRSRREPSGIAQAADEIPRQIWGASPPFSAGSEELLLLLKSASEPPGNLVVRAERDPGSGAILALSALRRLPEYGLAVPVSSARRLLGTYGGPGKGWRITLQEFAGEGGFSLPLEPGLLPGDGTPEREADPPPMRCTDLRPLGADAQGRLYLSAMIGYGDDGIREAFAYRFSAEGVFLERGPIPPSPGLLATRYVSVDPGGAVWCMRRAPSGDAVEFLRVEPDEED